MEIQPYRRWRQALFWISMPLGGLAILVIVGLGATVVAANRPSDNHSRSSYSGPTGSGATGTYTDITTRASVSASRTAPPALDGAGATISYDATNMVDGTPSTAWRAPGDATDVAIVFTLPEPVRLAAVGLIPGYAKQDPATGVDRFTQNRRISRARWVFEDGTSVEQVFQDTARMQRTPVDVVTGRILLQVLATVPGSPDFDFTAVSDAQIVASS
ncbi:conserved hypothetical protein [Parafrankia sp. EAN1pec]|uniref:NADase-type glycan-binding domain-containing protein n=1 Tax=Parafrankia sp. (strain EAN1pec) TaxID=298653 RepID=UPI0000542ADA|nr:conserved hypothetical protein [Frankia sp. EAN1pec]